MRTTTSGQDATVSDWFWITQAVSGVARNYHVDVSVQRKYPTLAFDSDGQRAEFRQSNRTTERDQNGLPILRRKRVTKNRIVPANLWLALPVAPHRSSAPS